MRHTRLSLRVDRDATNKVMGSGTNGNRIARNVDVKLFADQIRAFVPQSFTVLGTDGYGRSDSREALRKHLFLRKHVFT